MPPEVCPICDTPIPDGASACPECGADESTGWSQAAYCDRLGIPDPDEDFDHSEFVRQEFGDTRRRPRTAKTLWLITAVVLLIAFLAWLF